MQDRVPPFPRNKLEGSGVWERNMGEMQARNLGVDLTQEGRQRVKVIILHEECARLYPRMLNGVRHTAIRFQITFCPCAMTFRIERRVTMLTHEVMLQHPKNLVA